MSTIRNQYWHFTFFHKVFFKQKKMLHYTSQNGRYKFFCKNYTLMKETIGIKNKG